MKPASRATAASSPHSFGKSDSKYFTTLLTVSPVGDDLTLSFAEALMDGEKLGQGPSTDYLSISFSSTDYIGHLFGPSAWRAKTICCGWIAASRNCLNSSTKRLGCKTP